MPNQYKNKVVYGDSVLMDITDTTAEAGDVASGAVFYAKNGARTVGTFTQAQSDWNEDDTTDPAFILNKPPIIAGDGSYSTVENQVEQDSDATTYTLTISGDAKASTFSYTYSGEDSLPSESNLKTYGLARYSDTVYRFITGIDTTNNTITLHGQISNSAITNETLTIYYRYHLAIGDYSHAEGSLVYAIGEYAHAEGFKTRAFSIASHAEGYMTKARNNYCHAEGNKTVSSGLYGHAEGNQTEVTGVASHAEGSNTIASSSNQHVQGKYNIEDSNGVYADIVGNGTSSARSNAYTLDWNGNGWFAGKVSAGTIDTPASVANANDLTTKAYVDSKVMVVTFSEDPQDETAFIMDKTLLEIFTHYNNGGIIVASYGPTIYQLEYFDNDEVLPSLKFSRTDMSDSGYVTYQAFAVWGDGSIFRFYYHFGIPSASSSAPLVDGASAVVGTSTAYARADHVHPKITQTISMSNNVITLTGSDGSTSSVTLPVYNGGVTGVTGATGGSS